MIYFIVGIVAALLLGFIIGKGPSIATRYRCLGALRALDDLNKMVEALSHTEMSSLEARGLATAFGATSGNLWAAVHEKMGDLEEADFGEKQVKMWLEKLESLG